MRILLAIAISALSLVTFGQIPFSLQDRAFITSTSPLRKDLAGYWRLEESSGTRYDCSKNGNHLTSNNSVGQASGKVGNAASFASASSQSLSIEDNSTLAPSLNFEIHLWVKLRTKTSTMVALAQYDSASNQRGYQVQYNHTADRFQFLFTTNNSTVVTIQADNSGAISTNTWYHVAVYSDDLRKGISINNDTFTVSGSTNPIFNSTAIFRVGAIFDTPSFFWNGDIDEIGMWKRTLTFEERAQLYNSGNGVTFPRFSANIPNWIIDPDWSGRIVDDKASPLVPGTPWATYATIRSTNKTFVTWVGSEINNYVAQKTDGQNWGPRVFLGTGGTPPPTPDSNHNYGSLLIDNNGYLHGFYGCHATTMFYRKSTLPNDCSTWGSEVSLFPYASYPKAVVDQSNKIYAFCRGNTNGTITSTFSMKTSADSGASWSAETMLIDSGDENVWSYVGIPIVGNETPQNSIHFAWTWRSNSGPNDSSRYTNIYYMKSLDGGSTWKKSNGTDYTLPISTSTAELIYSGNAVSPTSVVLDTNNVPHVLSVVSSDAGYWTNSVLKLTSLSGGSWSTQTLPGTGYYSSGYLIIDTNNVFTVVGTKPVSGVFQVFTLTSSDGTSWASEQLTSNLLVNQYNVTGGAPRSPINSRPSILIVDGSGWVRSAERN